MQLTPEVMAELGATLGTMLGEGALVVSARDYYPPSRMLKRAFSSGLMSTGITVMDFHGATLPELAFAIKRFGAKAGVYFTVSTLREDGVMIKLLDSTSAEFSHDRLGDLLRLYGTKHIVRTLPSRIGWVSYAEYIHDIYVASLVSVLDINAILGGNFKIVIDSNFGPVADVLPNFLAEIGVESVVLNSHRPPLRRGVWHLPTPEAISTLARMVKASGANFGVAFCSDAARILLIDERGRVLTPDQTAAILMHYLPERSKVVVSETMSLVVEAVAKERGHRLVKVKGFTGDVSRQIRRVRASFGATDRGEYIFPHFSLSPDGILALGKILEYMAISEERLSDLAGSLPDYERFELEIDASTRPMSTILRALAERMRPSLLTMLGVKVVDGARWAYVEPDVEKRRLLVWVERPSNEKIRFAKDVARKVSAIIEAIEAERV